MIIRKETLNDYLEIEEVIKSAFPFREELGHVFNEWVVVEAVRNSNSYINELSLVAEIDDKVVGHTMFTPLKVVSDGALYNSLALAPVSVHKDFQNRGIGKQLINTGINAAKELGYQSIIVIGDYKYYSKFGFEKAFRWNIGLDGDFNCDYLFALELVEGGLTGVSGNVEYCPEFYNEAGELI